MAHMVFDQLHRRSCPIYYRKLEETNTVFELYAGSRCCGAEIKWRWRGAIGRDVSICSRCDRDTLVLADAKYPTHYYISKNGLSEADNWLLPTWVSQWVGVDEEDVQVTVEV